MSRYAGPCEPLLASNRRTCGTIEAETKTRYRHRAILGRRLPLIRMELQTVCPSLLRTMRCARLI